jgi:hypothetical protein
MSDGGAVLGVIALAADQQRLTELEEVEIQRQQDLLEAQLHFAATLQADLDALRVVLQSARSPITGTSHPDTTHELMTETMSSGDI